MAFARYPDRFKPLEHGDLLLSPDDAPQPRPNGFIADFYAMISGFSAKIIGKREASE
jgi:hypothetical protein